MRDASKLAEARRNAEVYHGLKADLAEAREELVSSVLAASENGFSQHEIADETKFQRARIQQFLREARNS